MLKEASFYAKLINQDVQCHLCPHACVLHPDDRGKCQVRRDLEGKLIAENYGLVSSIQLDPIEKKPFYHFCPGSKILSIGSVGCNLKCNFCQNCEISQTTVDDYLRGHFYEPNDIAEKAKKEADNIGLAFTYNEPTVYYEFMFEVAQITKASGMKNLMVSNGFIQREPLLQLIPYIDAFNIDLKAYCKKFYRNIGDGRLEPVLETLKAIRKSGKHLEVTFLLIPSLNDDVRKFKSMVSWIRDELGKQTVLHISRYFPAYKSRVPKTAVGLMFSFCETARAYLDYVYLGNITGSDSQNTICSQCGKIVISRYGYFIQKNGIDQQGRCVHCNNQIVII
jgi:pyruvate formate lyase activating enzyme